MGRWHANGVTEGPSSIESPPIFAMRWGGGPFAKQILEGRLWLKAPPSRLRRATSPSQVDGEDKKDDRKAPHPHRTGVADRAIACFAADVPI